MPVGHLLAAEHALAPVAVPAALVLAALVREALGLDPLVVGPPDGVAARAAPVPQVQHLVRRARAVGHQGRVDEFGVVPGGRGPLGHVPALVVAGHEAAVLVEVLHRRGRFRIVDHDRGALLVDRGVDLRVALLGIVVQRGLRVAPVPALALPLAVGVADVLVALALVAPVGHAPEEGVLVEGGLHVVGQHVAPAGRVVPVQRGRRQERLHAVPARAQRAGALRQRESCGQHQHDRHCPTRMLAHFPFSSMPRIVRPPWP